MRMEDAMEENISSDNSKHSAVKSTRAQKYGSAPVEGSTSAMTRESITDEIQALLWKLDDRKLRIAYQFIKKLIG